MTKVNSASHDSRPKLPQVMTKASPTCYPNRPPNQTNQAMASIVHHARTHRLAELIDLLLEVPHNVEHAGLLSVQGVQLLVHPLHLGLQLSLNSSDLTRNLGDVGLRLLRARRSTMTLSSTASIFASRLRPWDRLSRFSSMMISLEASASSSPRAAGSWSPRALSFSTRALSWPRTSTGIC